MRRMRGIIFFMLLLAAVQTFAATIAKPASNIKLIPPRPYCLSFYHLPSRNNFFDVLFNGCNHLWLTQTNFGYLLQQHTKPEVYLETTQPIYREVNHNWFWQARYAYYDIIPTINFGSGYRFLSCNKKWMFGINGFYDFTTRYTYKRVGLGGEFYTEYFTLRGNFYNALSGVRFTKNTNSDVSQALDGFDYSAEIPLPYYPWIHWNIGKYHWLSRTNTYITGRAVDGFLTGLRIFPARQLEITAGYSFDSLRKNHAFINFVYYLGAPEFIQYSATTFGSAPGFVPRCLECMRFEKVRRNNDITVQYVSEIGARGRIDQRGIGLV